MLNLFLLIYAPHDCETDLRKRRRNRQKGFDVFVDRIETGKREKSRRSLSF